MKPIALSSYIITSVRWRFVFSTISVAAFIGIGLYLISFAWIPWWMQYFVKENLLGLDHCTVHIFICYEALVFQKDTIRTNVGK